ncbi:MAG: beta galactosidase jelly roll domain-containing protein, partial [Phycisphaeraceae bacterium]|nr:beta galactosidase jelly roll domain-containing protein [Phycisphaeraceae bacterium]
MYKTVVGIILSVVCVSAQAYVPVDQGGDWERSLNGRWRFMLNGPEEDFVKPDFNVSAWQPIRVPGHWETQGFEEPLYKEPREGVGLYRRDFTVPEAWADRRVFIRFEGVLYGFEFWVNGEHAGRFESAFNRSEFDVTDLIKRDGPNVLAVRVYRRFKGWQFDTFDGWGISGIYRDVSLFAVHDTHIHDLTVVTTVSPDLSKASVQCKITMGASDPADLTVSSTLKGPDGRTVGQDQSILLAKHTVTFAVDRPQLWNAETPDLYDLKVDLCRGQEVLHTVTQK